MTLQNELNHEFANAEVLLTTATVAGVATRQQPHVTLASIPDPERFDGSREKLQAFISHLCMTLAGDASGFPNIQHKLQYTFGLLVDQAFDQVKPILQTRVST
jgi:hypothetical protein